VPIVSARCDRHRSTHARTQGRDDHESTTLNTYSRRVKGPGTDSHKVGRVVWWRNGRASDLRSRGREFDLRPGRGCVTTTLGKLFTPNCFDADTLN